MYGSPVYAAKKGTRRGCVGYSMLIYPITAITFVFEVPSLKL
jgi:hypothetical protein